MKETLDSAGPGAKLLVYVVPLEWRLADLPMEPPRPDDRGHQVPADFDRDAYKVLFTRVRSHDPTIHGKEIVTRAYGRDPLLLVKVNTQQGQVTGIETPPPHVRWGDIPTPLF